MVILACKARSAIRLGVVSLALGLCACQDPGELSRNGALELARAGISRCEAARRNPGDNQAFPHDGETYRWLHPDYDTAEKLRTQLTAVFTQAAATRQMEEWRLLEREGRLARLEAGEIAFEDWERARLKFIDESETTALARVDAPSANDEVTVYEVRFRKEGGVWKLDATLEEMLQAGFDR
jgi:IseA DL-endopeptidase inhibitor